MNTVIFITGYPHSGTRLLFDMFSRHPDIMVPKSLLNEVREYSPLHHFFIKMLDQTPLHSEEYAFDEEEFEFIMQAYFKECTTGRVGLIKMPHYPVANMDNILTYFRNMNQQVCFLSGTRNLANTYKSFVNRGQQNGYLRYPKKIRQAKKAKRMYRTDCLNSNSFEEIMKYQFKSYDEWLKHCTNSNIFSVSVDSLSDSVNFNTLQCLLKSAQLSEEPLRSMYNIVDTKRLRHSFLFLSKSKIMMKLRAWLMRNINPP